MPLADLLNSVLIVSVDLASILIIGMFLRFIVLFLLGVVLFNVSLDTLL